MRPPRMSLHAAFGWWGQKSKRVMEAATMLVLYSRDDRHSPRHRRLRCLSMNANVVRAWPRTEAVATLAAGFG
jgi:hypothetical protein